MITPGFSPTATERILPKLALDFTTASLDSRVTFTRALNTATVTNSSGNIVSINANLPRFDYDPITLACKGLLIEEARTNNFTYSDQFDNALWLKYNVTIAQNSVVSPDGTQNADTMTYTGTVGALYRSAGSIGTFSTTCYMKAGTNNYAAWVIGNNAVDGGYVVFDLVNGVVGQTRSGTNVTGVTGSISAAKNGYFRCNISYGIAVYATNHKIELAPALTGNTFDSNGEISGNTIGKYIYVWGAQNETGAFPTSYIPTTTLAVLRNADTAVMTSTNFSAWYTATTGAASVWAIPQTATNTRPLIQFDDTTSNEIINLRGNVADPELYIVEKAGVQVQIDTGTIVANTLYKLTGAWNTNNCAAAKDGGSVGVDTVATIPTPTQLRIGSDGTNYACAWIQKILYWPQRIINAEVQAFSK